MRTIRAMTAAVLVMAACGSPQTTIEQQRTEPVVRVVPADASAESADVADASVALVDASIEAVAPTDAVGSVYYYENGIHVALVDAPQWCSPGKDGHCAATEQECRDMWRGCKPVTSWACFEIEDTTLGPLCSATLASCQEIRAEKAAIFAGVGACTLARLRGASDATAPVDPDVFEEGGVQVFVVDKPRWCSHSGDLRGGCWPSAAKCNRDAKSCRRATSWACFDSTSRTSGKTEEVCAITYALCDKLREFTADNPEQIETGACVIMRLRKGRK